MNAKTEMKLSTVLKTGAAVAATLVSGGAMAAIDTTAATTAITGDAGGAVTAIGTAMLGLAAMAVAFKWAKAAIFG